MWKRGSDLISQSSPVHWCRNQAQSSSWKAHVHEKRSKCFGFFIKAKVIICLQCDFLGENGLFYGKDGGKRLNNGLGFPWDNKQQCSSPRVTVHPSKDGFFASGWDIFDFVGIKAGTIPFIFCWDATAVHQKLQVSVYFGIQSSYCSGFQFGASFS